MRRALLILHLIWIVIITVAVAIIGEQIRTITQIISQIHRSIGEAQ